jgi:UDP-N-acetylglucosamine--N-acetylmuramyl-(pentapeptide) pyrophosphoryl-undecaprenol N-acetylglucosamine transferase
MSARTGGSEGRQERPLRVLIAGGGTGGHVYPGLAVAEALRELRPQCDVRFAGTSRGLEALLIPRAGYRLYRIPASGFRGLGPGARLRFLLNFLAGVVRGLQLLVTWRPDVLLGTGGYVSAPALAAARLLGRPCALQEQNAIPGSANRLLARWSRRIYLGFAAAAEHFPGRDCRVTGNPVRAAFTAQGEHPTASAAGDPAPGQNLPAPAGQVSPLDRELRLLIFGGSRGAHTLNRAACQAAPRWREQHELAVWLQTGPAERDEVAAAFADFPAGRARVDAYLFDMPGALRWADLAVCRAGAMTLAELSALGKPAVLVPFPHATDDHQLQNARDCEAAGAAVVLEDASCDGPALADAVATLGADRAKLAAMGKAAGTRSAPDAARRIAEDLIQLAGGNGAAAGGTNHVP